MNRFSLCVDVSSIELNIIRDGMGHGKIVRN